MSEPDHRHVEHRIDIAAPAEDVYRLLVDVANWPRIFPPSIHVDHVERGESRERIRIWADVNGQVRSWISRRFFNSDELRIDFRQENPKPPFREMGGTWIVQPTGSRRCAVKLLHNFRAVHGDPRALEWIGHAVDANSRSELTALKTNAEFSEASAELLLSFEDTEQVNGSARDVYDFINEAQHWPDRLPHVARVTLREGGPGVQDLRMVTRTQDGTTHTTQSFRVCSPHHRIAYKQTVLPELLTAHIGCWRIDESADGVTTVVSQHTAVIAAESIPRVLGGRSDVAAARRAVRAALGGNSRTTLAHARAYAESRR